MTLITYLTRIHFADGVLEDALKAELDAAGLKRPLIVTDKGVVAAGLVDRLLAALPRGTVATLHDATPANPTEAAARAAAASYQGNGCDGLISLGGGSAIDLAKAAALSATHDGPLLRYAAVEGGSRRIGDRIPPHIAVPTTAGTGSEVGRGALIILDDGRKLGILSPHLIPTAAICDPTLTVGLPPELTAGTGMDAITHCIETYIAASYNPPADGIALDGLARGWANLRRAVENGRDLAARREMMAAAMNGALAFQKGLGGVHAASHALGGMKDGRLHHGTLNAILLPHVLAFNAPAAHHRYAALAEAMHLRPGEALDDAVHRRLECLRLPTRLGQLGLDPETLDRAAPLAEKDHTNGTNPRRASAEDYRTIMRSAL